MTTHHAEALTVESHDDVNEWDSFVVRNDGSPFALRGWSDAVGTYGLDRWHLVARDRGSIVGALALVRLESRIFGDTLVSLPYTSQGGLVLSDRRTERAKRRLLEEAKRLADELGVDVLSLRSTDAGSQPGFTRQTRYVTFEVPVGGGVESVRENLKESRRRQLRQAEENDDLEFVVGDSLDDLRDFYELYLRSMQGHGTPPHSFEFFRVLWDRLHDDHLRLGLVRTDGAVINGILDLALGSQVVQKSVVSDYDYRDLNGGTLLHWKSLEWACEEGYDCYHLGRTRPDTGIHYFKQTFGGEEVTLVDTQYFPNEPYELPDAEDETFDLPRRLWRKLPLPVTRVLGPPIRKNISL